MESWWLVTSGSRVTETNEQELLGGGDHENANLLADIFGEGGPELPQGEKIVFLSRMTLAATERKTSKE